MDEVNQTAKVSFSKAAWIPFIIVFVFVLTTLVLSFAGNASWANKMPVVRFSKDDATHRMIQLIIMGVLLLISLLLPFWVYSLRAGKTKYDQPLGLPPGSIRAMIVLMAACAYMVLSVKERAFEDAKHIFILMAALYFLTRVPERGKERDH